MVGSPSLEAQRGHCGSVKVKLRFAGAPERLEMAESLGTCHGELKTGYGNNLKEKNVLHSTKQEGMRNERHHLITSY